MSTSIQERVNRLLDQHDQDCESAQKNRKQSQRQEQRFLNQFDQLRKNIIRPCMEEIKTSLQDRGHYVEISEHEFEYKKEKQDPIEAEIIFYLGPDGKGDYPNVDLWKYPKVAFTTRTYARTTSSPVLLFYTHV